MGREEHCKQMSLACVGSTSSVPATLGLPPLTVCVLSPSTLLRLQVALQGAGPELRVLPRPKPLKFQVLLYSTKAQTRLGLRFVPSLVRAAQGIRSLTNVLSPGAVRLLPFPSQPQLPGAPVQCALCLFWRADLWLRPSRQMSTIQNLRKSLVRDWKPVCSLVGDALSEAQFAPFSSHLPPASSGGWAGLQLACSSLVLLSPSFVL